MHGSIESLPLDALVQIFCKLKHDELRPLLTVSKSFHDAAHVARRLHFDFSTPPVWKKSFAFTSDPECSPGRNFMRLELKRSQRFKLPEEETRKIAVVLFPEGYCKRHLIPGFGCVPKHNRSLVHVSHAKA